MSPDEALIGVRAVHYAATLLAAGAAFFVVFVAKATPAALRSRLAATGWSSLALAVLSGAGWLLFTAQSMSGQSLGDVLAQGVIGTVLLRTDFGNDWLIRLALVVILGALFVPLLSVGGQKAGSLLKTAVVTAAAALTGSLAWAGHAIGAQGVESVVHPGVDVLHLVAAAAWVGSLPFYVLLLAAARRDRAPLPLAHAATLRFSTLGIVCVCTLLVTGVVNACYLVGSTEALNGTFYGRLLIAKVALFLVMVAVAAVNRLRLTPQLAGDGRSARSAVRRLQRNAAVETVLGVIVIGIVAVLGTEPPASHLHHHPAYGALPADAAFVHIHTDHGMADVAIEPGRPGTARATIRLWNGDFGELDARALTLTLTPPGPGAKATTHIAALNADGAWEVGGIALPQAGNWTVTVDAEITSSNRLVLEAPIVIAPGP